MAAAAAMAGLTLAGAYNESVALGEQAKNEELNARLNADVLKTNARLREKVGKEEAAALQKKIAKFKGSQRAALAASGVSVDYGSAAAIQEETAIEGALDVERVMNNATLEAFGLRSQASQTLLQGQSNAQGLRNRAGATLLGGVLQGGAYAYQGMGKIKVPETDAGSAKGIGPKSAQYPIKE